MNIQSKHEPHNLKTKLNSVESYANKSEISCDFRNSNIDRVQNNENEKKHYINRVKSNRTQISIALNAVPVAIAVFVNFTCGDGN